MRNEIKRRLEIAEKLVAAQKSVIEELEGRIRQLQVDNSTSTQQIALLRAVVVESENRWAKAGEERSMLVETVRNLSREVNT